MGVVIEWFRCTLPREGSVELKPKTHLETLHHAFSRLPVPDYSAYPVLSQVYIVTIMIALCDRGVTIITLLIRP